MGRASTKRLRVWVQMLAIGVLAAIGLVTYASRSAALQGDLLQADPDAILDDRRMKEAALDLGRQVYLKHCATCHGSAGEGARRGIPALSDDDFLYGSGRASEIEAIVLHGIRSGDSRGFHFASMPAYGTAKPYALEAIESLQPAEIDDVVDFLLAKQTGLSATANAVRGQEIYSGRGGCYDCHGPDAAGDPAIGAPNLIDSINLYGDGSRAALQRSITYGRAGSCPAFGRRLTPLQIRAVAVYTAALHRQRGERR